MAILILASSTWSDVTQRQMIQAEWGIPHQLWPRLGRGHLAIPSQGGWEHLKFTTAETQLLRKSDEVEDKSRCLHGELCLEDAETWGQ